MCVTGSVGEGLHCNIGVNDGNGKRQCVGMCERERVPVTKSVCVEEQQWA